MLKKTSVRCVAVLALAAACVACGPGEKDEAEPKKEQVHTAAPTGARPDVQSPEKREEKGPVVIAAFQSITGNVTLKPPAGPPVEASVGAKIFAGSSVTTGKGSRAVVNADWTGTITLGEGSTLLLPALGECGAILTAGKVEVTSPKRRAPVSVCFVHTPSAALEPSAQGALEINVNDRGKTRVKAKGDESFIVELNGERAPLKKGPARSLEVDGETPEERLVAVDKIFARLLLDVGMLAKLRDENKDLLERRRSEKTEDGRPSEKWAALTKELTANAEQLAHLRRAATVELMRIQALMARELSLEGTTDQTRDHLTQTRNRLKSLAQDLPQLFTPRSR